MVIIGTGRSSQTVVFFGGGDRLLLANRAGLDQTASKRLLI